MSSEFTSKYLFSFLQENNVKLSICNTLKKLFELEHESLLDELIFDTNSYCLFEEWLLKHLYMRYGDAMVHVAKRFNTNFNQRDNTFMMREYLLMAYGIEELDRLGKNVRINVTGDACFMINSVFLDSEDRLPVTDVERQELPALKARVSKRLVNNAQAESGIEPIHVLIDEINSLTQENQNRLIKADPTLTIIKKGVIYYADSVFWSNIYHELLPLIDNTMIE